MRPGGKSLFAAQFFQQKDTRTLGTYLPSVISGLLTTNLAAYVHETDSLLFVIGALFEAHCHCQTQGA